MTRPTASRQTACRQLVEAGGLHRRTILKAGALSLFGLGLPDLVNGRSQPIIRTNADPLQRSFGRAKSCILLFMWGGPAHQDTWDLKPNAPAEIRGEFRPIATRVPGIDISEHFPQLAQRTDKLCIIRSMTHEDVNHITSTHYLLTGQAAPPGNDIHNDWPHMGAVLSKLHRGTGPLPPFVSMRPKLENTVPRFVEETRGQFAGWLGQAHNPMTIDANPAVAEYRIGNFSLAPEISVARLDQRRRLLQEIDRRRNDLASSGDTTAMHGQYARAFELLHAATGGDAFDLSAEPEKIRDRYGRNPHGQSVLQARRLVERGVPLVTVFWPNDGVKNVSVYWDTHSKNFIDLKTRLMPVGEQAFAALLDDLEQRGLLEETLVVWTGEFGRTPKVGQRNSDAGAGRDGRDHWPNCFTTVLAGGGINKGTVYGSSDRFAAYPASNAVRPMDLVATIYHALGVPADLELHDSLGRPLVVSPGHVIGDLLA